jgi:hypothetical protein
MQRRTFLESASLAGLSAAAPAADQEGETHICSKYLLSLAALEVRPRETAERVLQRGLS